MGSRVVPIELGKHYMDEATFAQQLMPFGVFLKKHVLKACATTGYLAQTELLQQVPALLKVWVFLFLLSSELRIAGSDCS